MEQLDTCESGRQCGVEVDVTDRNGQKKLCVCLDTWKGCGMKGV